MEDLAYRRLLDQYYLREGPLPADIQATAKLVRMRSCAADVESVLREFFTLTEAGWTHRRCDLEIERMQDKQAKARASAAVSVSVRQAKQQAAAERALASAEADAERTLPDAPTDVELPTPTPTPTPTEEIHTQPLSATDGGRVCGLMRQAGLSDGNPGHPDLLALIAAGATDAEFIGASQAAVGNGKGFAYAIGTLKRQRIDAASSAAVMHVGALPTGPPDRKATQLQVAALMTGTSRTQQPREIIDVTPRIIAA